MNWLQKVSSVTFTLEQSNRIAQPRTISDIANNLYTWAENNIPRQYFEDQRMIDMDGLDVDSFTGIVNWYITKPELSNDIPMYINQWIQEEMAPLGFRVRMGELEQSGMFSDRLVQRIHIDNNPTVDYPKIPEMNLANDNAESLMNALGIPFDWDGAVDLNELKTKLEMFTPWDQQDLTRDPEHDISERVQLFQGGRTPEQVSRYIDGLRRMVEFGLKNGFETLTWG